MRVAVLRRRGPAGLRSHAAVVHEGAHRQLIGALLVDGDLDLTDVVRQACVGSLGIVSQGLPGLGNVDLHGSVNALVDGGAVHVNDLLALLGVGLDDSVLHVLHGVLDGDDAGEVEEGSLQHGVGAVAQAQLHSDSGSVDGVEIDLTLGDLTLHAVGQMLLQLSAGPAGVQQEGAVRLDLGNDIEVLDVRGLVAGHKVSHGDIVGAVDGLMAKAQVGLGNAAGLLGVILEVSVSVLVGVVTDDLDGVLVGAHGTVRAQTPELAGDDGLTGGDDVLANGQRQVSDVIVDTNGEVVLLLTIHVVEHGLHLGRSGILGAQAVKCILF